MVHCSLLCYEIPQKQKVIRKFDYFRLLILKIETEDYALLGFPLLVRGIKKTQLLLSSR